MNSGGPSKPFTVILALLLFGPLALSWLARTGSQRATLADLGQNLRILEGAKEQYALEHHATNGTLPTPAELAPYLRDGRFPKPVSGETYSIKAVGELNAATLTRRLGNYEAGQVFTVTSF